MKQRITAFIEHLGLFDYLLFAGSVTLFLLLMILALLLRRRAFFSAICMLAALAVITLGPTLGYVKLNDLIFSHTLNVEQVQRLEFSDALVVRGTLENTSKNGFASCRISAEAYKVEHNPLFDPLFRLNPFKTGSIVLQDVPQGVPVPFKIFVEPFHYDADYNVSIGATCR